MDPINRNNPKWRSWWPGYSTN